MALDWKDALSQLRDSGSLPEGEEPEATAATDDSVTKPNDVIHVVVERKGRKGKTATIAEGFTCSDGELADIASRAKQRLGTGGSARGGEILIQGECRDRLADFLRSLGYRVK